MGASVACFVTVRVLGGRCSGAMVLVDKVLKSCLGLDGSLWTMSTELRGSECRDGRVVRSSVEDGTVVSRSTKDSLLGESGWFSFGCMFFFIKT